MRDMALEPPRLPRGQCVKAAVKKRVGLRGVARLGESGPGGTKATERPMCEESCKGKRVGFRGVAR